ncbi:hypothetical protein ACHWQZ_G012161 [Mnemiopsis leidyi]
MSILSSGKANQTTVWCDDLEEDSTRQVTVRGSLVRYTVFVCKLGCKITEEDLTLAITDFLEKTDWTSTKITTVKICKTKSGVSKGYGFIELDNDAACISLISQKTITIGSREVTVSEAVRKHPEEIVLRKEHVELTSEHRRRESKSSDDNSENRQICSPPYGEAHASSMSRFSTSAHMMTIPTATGSPISTSPTSPGPVLISRQHSVLQPSPLMSSCGPDGSMMQQVPCSRIVVPPGAANSSASMLSPPPCGIMQPSPLLSPSAMSPVSSLVNVMSPDQTSNMFTSSSLPHPLMHQGITPSMVQSCPLLLNTSPRTQFYAPVYYQQYPPQYPGQYPGQFPCLFGAVPAGCSYQDPSAFCYVTSM